jgi:hypothetical protein
MTEGPEPSFVLEGIAPAMDNGATPWDAKLGAAKSRVVSILPSGEIALEIVLDAPLGQEFLAPLEAELRAAEAHTTDDYLAVTHAQVEGDRIQLRLAAVEPSTFRFETLMACAREIPGCIGPDLAAYLVYKLAVMLERPTEGSAGHAQAAAHGYLSKRSILIDRAGTMTIVGSPSEAVSTLLMPPLDQGERYRWLAPEAARREPRTAAADVYALAVLYYELLAGEPYRSTLGTMELTLATIEGFEPDLPGQLPDPRPSLIALFENALAPDPRDRPESATAFADALRDELTASGVKLSGNSELQRAIEASVPRDLNEAPNVLLGASKVPRAPSNGPQNAPPAPLGDASRVGVRVTGVATAPGAMIVGKAATSGEEDSARPQVPRFKSGSKLRVRPAQEKVRGEEPAAEPRSAVAPERVPPAHAAQAPVYDRPASLSGSQRPASRTRMEDRDVPWSRASKIGWSIAILAVFALSWAYAHFIMP